MTKFEAWQAWCKKAGTEHLALESIMSQSSHCKAFSFAWDEAVKFERQRICKQIAQLHDILTLESIPPNDRTEGLRIKDEDHT